MQRGLALIGCAGWSLPGDVQHEFPSEGSHLERYATRLPSSEINSSFHRPHAPSVWRRWADSVPDGFQFSVKLPKTITHEHRLVDVNGLLDGFMAQASLLATRLGCLLVQLPPSLAFDHEVAKAFFSQLRQSWAGPACLEPRHSTWFDPAADDLLNRHGIARVLADPVRHSEGVWPGGWPGMVYLRLHGSPRMYYSAYNGALIHALAQRIQIEVVAGRDVWCIFDNTAAGAAVHNAVALRSALEG